MLLVLKEQKGGGGSADQRERVSLTPRPLGLSICILSSRLIVSPPLTSSVSISASLSSSRFHTRLNDRIDRMQALHGLIRAHHFIVQPRSHTDGRTDGRVGTKAKSSLKATKAPAHHRQDTE